MNTLNKGIVLLLLALVIISVSGCVEKLSDNPRIPRQDLKGWDWEKYQKYSEFYDKINNSKPSSTDTLGDFMVGMPQDTEFDKTWYLTFLYFNRGLEANIKMNEQYKILQQERSNQPETRDPNEFRKSPLRSIESNIQKYREQSQGYFKNATEYRQKIEEMKPNGGING